MSQKNQENRKNRFEDVSRLSPIQGEESAESPSRRPRPGTRSDSHPATRSDSHPATRSDSRPARPDGPIPPRIIAGYSPDFYVRLEKNLKRVYRGAFVEGRNVRPIPADEERSNVNMGMDEGTDADGGNTEPGRKLKRQAKVDNSSESDKEEVESKRSKSRNVRPIPADEERSNVNMGMDEDTDADGGNTEPGRKLKRQAKVDNSSESDKEEVESKRSKSLSPIQGEESAESPSRRQRPGTRSDSRPATRSDSRPNSPILPTRSDSRPARPHDPIIPGIIAGYSPHYYVILEKNSKRVYRGPFVEGNNTSTSTAPDSIHDRKTLSILLDDQHDTEPAGEDTIELRGNNRVPDNRFSPPASEREEELRTQQDNNGDDDVIEERDAQTQTTFEKASPVDWGNFFVGTPRVFNLCDCKNHTCE